MTEAADPRARAGLELREAAGDLAAGCVERQLAQDPGLAARWGAAGRVRCVEDAAHHLRHLAEAVARDAPALFVDYLAWARELLAALGVPGEDLRAQLHVLRRMLRERLSDPSASLVVAFLDQGAHSLGTPPPGSASHLAGSDEHAALGREFLRELLEYRHRTASARLLEAVEQGLAVERLYLDVLQPTLREVGRLWQLGRIGVADEHYCTAAVQGVMARLHGRIFAVAPRGRRLVAACVGDELHEIGLRMVADLAALRGWETTFLGANLPVRHLLDVVEKRPPHVLALSTTIVVHLPEMERILAELRRASAGKVRTLVGGRPFCLEPELWRALGADGCAPDAGRGAELVEELAP